MKESAPETLIECMRLVRGGRRWFPGNLFAQKTLRTIELGKEKSTDELTSREREIAALVAEGLSNKRIATLLNVTEGTVKIHLHNVFAKLDVSNRTALATMVVSMRSTTVPRNADRSGDDRGATKTDERAHAYPTSAEDDAGRE